MIRKSYGCWLCMVFAAWADPAECFSAEAEGQAVQGRATLDHLSRPLEALLGAFESEGVAAAESLSERRPVADWRPSSRGLPGMDW